MHHKHHYKRLFIEFFVILAVVSILILIGKNIEYAKIITLMQEHRILGVLIYFVYIIISIVIIALPLVPLWPVALYLYGFSTSVVITIIGTVVGASLSFSIARRFGKPAVIKMIGTHLFDEIQHLIHVDNSKTFLLVRIFGNNYFDTISYIAGLSKLTYKKYMIITTIVTTCWTFVLFFLIQKAGGINNLGSLFTIMTGYATLILLGTISWEIFHKVRKNSK